jgi:hypothetical protein
MRKGVEQSISIGDTLYYEKYEFEKIDEKTQDFIKTCPIYYLYESQS